MTTTVIVMIVLGVAFVVASFIISEKLTNNEESTKVDLMTVDENYEFSDRELQIIKRKIEDVIANQAKDILYQTNESLSNMANEKTMALGDYAVAVCDEIENNHKQVMFLYSMLDDKQKEIMKTVREVDESKQEIRAAVQESRLEQDKLKETLTSIDKEEHIKQMRIDTPSTDNTNILSNENISVSDVSKEYAGNGDDKEISSFDQDIDLADNISENIDSEYVNTADETLEDIFSEIDNTDIDFDDVLENDFKNDANANDIILQMYENGNSIIEIAKELGLGVGEVKLVIDLYRGV